MRTSFDHAKLDVYQKSIDFIVWVNKALESVPRSFAVYKQLDRASTSIALNIAEGNGKYTEADRCRFFDIARGSALECSACLDVLVAKKLFMDVASGKAILVSVVSMLVGLIRATSSSRVYESSVKYKMAKPESANCDCD